MTTSTALPALSPQQEVALDKVGKWINDPNENIFRLFGYAGTGKTTIARRLTENLDGVVYFCAYTGKAAHVLRKMGCPGASTLHSLLYSIDPAEQERLQQMVFDLAAEKAEEDPDLDKIKTLKRDIEALRKKLRNPDFRWNPDGALRDARLVVIDECSMIDAQMAADLNRFPRLKILAMGDPGQLPPVRGEGFYMGARPDVTLTEIHRQAADNPILRYATAVREGRSIPFTRDDPRFQKLRRDQIHPDFLRDGIAAGTIGQILAGKNASRNSINKRVREVLGFASQYPQKGERVVVLRNDKGMGVLNGMLLTALKDASVAQGEEGFLFSGKTEDELQEFEDLLVDDVPFRKLAGTLTAEEQEEEWHPHERRSFLPMDFGYCLTVHKSQGSQWPRVTLWDDGFAAWDGTMRKRWLYTAITRAQEGMTIVAR